MQRRQHVQVGRRCVRGVERVLLALLRSDAPHVLDGNDVHQSWKLVHDEHAVLRQRVLGQRADSGDVLEPDDVGVPHAR
jgi:hypothetical protein